jgi:hypothetical protein
MKRVLGSTMNHLTYHQNIKSGIFGEDEYNFFCNFCDYDRRSEFTIDDLWDSWYGFELAFDYCIEHQVSFPDLLVFANRSASTSLCKISFGGKDIYIYYKFGSEKHINGTWNELLSELDSTIGLLARILDV